MSRTRRGPAGGAPGPLWITAGKRDHHQDTPPAYQPPLNGFDATPAPCWVCHEPTFGTSEHGRPEHPLCRPQHTSYAGRETSWAAGERADRGPRSKLAQKVLAELRAHPEGLTDDELAELLDGAHPGSCSKRRGDLVAAGLVVDSGATRATRWGRQAIVWRAVRS